jgi:quinol monooxygenase YgiN
MAFCASIAGAWRMPDPKGENPMPKGDSERLAKSGGLLVVASWEAKSDQADAVAEILRKFVPKARGEEGVQLFLVGRGKDNPAAFLFYELFTDEKAFAAHQQSEHFKSLITTEALPKLAKRERAQYTLL